MVRYWYSATPLVIVLGGLTVLTTPFLGLIAVMAVVLVALAALVWAIVSVAYMLGRAVARLWHSRSHASPRGAAALGAYRRAYVRLSTTRSPG